MRALLAVFLALCVLDLSANAYPMFHRKKGFGPRIMPVPVHPYPVYGPGYGPGPGPRGFGGDALTLLTSAALIGSGLPGGQALGTLGLASTLF